LKASKFKPVLIEIYKQIRASCGRGLDGLLIYVSASKKSAFWWRYY